MICVVCMCLCVCTHKGLGRYITLETLQDMMRHLGFILNPVEVTRKLGTCYG